MKLQVKNQMKTKQIKQKKQQLFAKEMHIQYLQLLDDPNIDKDLSLDCLASRCIHMHLGQQTTTHAGSAKP